jgi:hypothetical protein
MSTKLPKSLGDFPVVFSEHLDADEVLLVSPTTSCSICGRDAVLVVTSKAPSLTLLYCSKHKFKVKIDD